MTVKELRVQFHDPCDSKYCELPFGHPGVHEFKLRINR
jgi:hypothetical protein